MKKQKIRKQQWQVSGGAWVAGELVQAVAAAQGMAVGEKFAVLAVHEKFTPFGGFVTLLLGRRDGERTLQVVNGELLLRKVQDWS